MHHKGTVNLETERLILRKFKNTDVLPMFENWANDKKVAEYLTWQPHSDISETKSIIDSWSKLYEDKNYYNWVIILKDLGEPIGSISVVAQSETVKMVRIGYCIGRKWWHCCYVAEAFREVIRFLFEEIKVNRIEAKHDPDNINSGKVMLKCGLKYEGLMRQADISNKGIRDSAIYAILAEDYFNTCALSGCKTKSATMTALSQR